MNVKVSVHAGCSEEELTEDSRCACSESEASEESAADECAPGDWVSSFASTGLLMLCV